MIICCYKLDCCFRTRQQQAALIGRPVGAVVALLLLGNRDRCVVSDPLVLQRARLCATAKQDMERHRLVAGELILVIATQI